MPRQVITVLHLRNRHTSGFNIVTAENGREALEVLSTGTRRFSAIVLDLMLPEMDGFEFLKRFRERPEWKGIPIVILTGKELNADETKMLMKESRACISKGDEWKEHLIQQVEMATSRNHASFDRVSP